MADIEQLKAEQRRLKEKRNELKAKLRDAKKLLEAKEITSPQPLPQSVKKISSKRHLSIKTIIILRLLILLGVAAIAILIYSYGNVLQRKQLERLEQLESFTDSRDGKAYELVKVGTQTWMAENLNYNARGSKCYDNEPVNCEKYGRLYDWETALEACPAGWHLPSNKEWDKLYRYVDGNNGKENPYKSETAGKFLKAKNGWNENNGNDKFYFAALPGGDCNSDGSFKNIGKYGSWWSASQDLASNAYYRYMYYNNENALWGSYNKTYLFSIRCVQNVQNQK